MIRSSAVCITLLFVAVCALIGTSRAAFCNEPGAWTNVKAVFERRCVSCHAGDHPKGGLSLETAAAFARGSDSGPVVSPEDPATSLLLDVVEGDSPRMPPTGPKLTASELESLRGWVQSGAAFPDEEPLLDRGVAGDDGWWAWQPLTTPAVPSIESSWIRNPIDAFVLAKLNTEKLSPSPEADRRTLVRRLTFDLHGLPPTPAEVAEFVADPRPDAVERLVDRLLAAPEYGERWGRYWLDVVHFGETHGYDKDKPRPHAWRYRDYVISALNSDRPYSRFVQEQLAADVLFPDQPELTPALGFIAAGPWDFVGHVELREGSLDKKITRSNDRDDMVSNAASTFLSLTVHCARCHNHKFDPISQREYYSLQAVFAGVDRNDRPFDVSADVARQRVELTAKRAAAMDVVAGFEARKAAARSPRLTKLQSDLDQLASVIETLKAPPTPDSRTNGWHSEISSRQDVAKWVQLDLGEAGSIEAIELHPARPVDFPDTPGFGFPVRYSVLVSDSPEASGGTVVHQSKQDEAPPGDSPVRLQRPGLRGRFVRITAEKLWPRTGDFVFALGEVRVLRGGKNIALGAAVQSLDSIEAGLWSRRHLVDGYNSRKPVESEAGFETAVKRIPTLESSLQSLRAEFEAEIGRVLGADFVEQETESRKALATVEAAIKNLPPQEYVYAASNLFDAIHSFTSAGKPRPVYLLHRGSDESPREEVSPQGLELIVGLQSRFDIADLDNEGLRRAALARWITDPKNGLTRRSIVNRVWQQHFGRGIVDSPNDFGHQGERPTHPELLDWLSGEFMRRGESLKELHRLICTSSTYRQVSAFRPDAAAVDADNRWLWRGHRRRLEAEAIRDSVLAVSGDLDRTVGGPSVQQFYFKDDHSPVYDYEQFDVDSPGSRRRSVYRFIVRSVPDPWMESLDCADPSLLTPKRNTTLTAVQALSLLNNKFMTRQAERWAGRLQREKTGLDDQLALAFEEAFSRPIRDAELHTLLPYGREHGLANVCRLLLNANEFVFVD